VRDPAAVKPMLAALEGSGDDHMFAQNLVKALGTTGANEALPLLRKLVASSEQKWLNLRPWVSNAIVRIETGNPESLIVR
jgi:HEAT repeat protein